MELKEADEAAAKVQRTPYRISLDYMESQIDFEETTLMSVGRMTVTTLVMKNGYVVVGKSAPADPENFDAELGKKFAREDAVRQLWPLFAFALKTEMAAISIMEELRARSER